MVTIDSVAGFANDAGGGKCDAGFAGMQILAEKGIAGATYSHLSAVIGDGHDGWENGILSRVNEPAAVHGLAPGMRVKDAVATIAVSLRRTT